MAWMFVLECVEDMCLRLLELLPLGHFADDILRHADHIVVERHSLQCELISYHSNI